MITNKIIT